MTRVKVCGLTNIEDIRLCAAAGADALGFVVEYPIDVPWNLDRKTAMDLIRAVPPFVATVIVLGDDAGRATTLTKTLRPHAVQLHGNEPLDVTKELTAKLKAEAGVKVIKALRFSAETGKCLSECRDPLDAGRRLEDAGVDAVVMDSVSRKRPAGTGIPLDLRMAKKIRHHLRIPVILAGGLNSGNVARAIDVVGPYGVDVISGVENPVRKKDPDRLGAFFKAIRASTS